MDGLSVAGNLAGIATAGVALSIKLVTLATQISTASERVSSIANDVSLTSGILQQLGELMTQKTTSDGCSIFNKIGLETTKASAIACERLFHTIDVELRKASSQIRGCKRLEDGKVKLTKTERAKWPFLQPNIDVLRNDLREAKGTLMLMLQVTSLALSKRMAELNQSASTSMHEQKDLMRAILAFHQRPHSGTSRASDTEQFSPLPNIGQDLPPIGIRGDHTNAKVSLSGPEVDTISHAAQPSIHLMNAESRVPSERPVRAPLKPSETSIDNSNKDCSAPSAVIRSEVVPERALTVNGVSAIDALSCNDCTERSNAVGSSITFSNADSRCYHCGTTSSNHLELKYIISLHIISISRLTSLYK